MGKCECLGSFYTLYVWRVVIDGQQLSLASHRWAGGNTEIVEAVCTYGGNVQLGGKEQSSKAGDCFDTRGNPHQSTQIFVRVVGMSPVRAGRLIRRGKACF